MPHLTRTTALKAALLRSGAYETLGAPSRIVNGRVYFRRSDGSGLYVGPGAFHNPDRGAILFIHEAHDHGHYCLLENRTPAQADAALAAFLSAHGADEASLRARTVRVPPGWTADP